MVRKRQKTLRENERTLSRRAWVCKEERFSLLFKASSLLIFFYYYTYAEIWKESSVFWQTISNRTRPKNAEEGRELILKCSSCPHLLVGLGSHFWHISWLCAVHRKVQSQSIHDCVLDNDEVFWGCMFHVWSQLCQFSERKQNFLPAPFLCRESSMGGCQSMKCVLYSWEGNVASPTDQRIHYFRTCRSKFLPQTFGSKNPGLDEFSR